MTSKRGSKKESKGKSLRVYEHTLKYLRLCDFM